MYVQLHACWAPQTLSHPAAHDHEVGGGSGDVGRVHTLGVIAAMPRVIHPQGGSKCSCIPVSLLVVGIANYLQTTNRLSWLLRYTWTLLQHGLLWHAPAACCALQLTACAWHLCSRSASWGPLKPSDGRHLACQQALQQAALLQAARLLRMMPCPSRASRSACLASSPTAGSRS